MKWKTPTWKGLIGILTMASGIISSLTVNGNTLPKPVDAALIAIGGVLVSIERLADAFDYRTDNPAPQPTTSIVTPTTAAVPTPLPAPPTGVAPAKWTGTITVTPTPGSLDLNAAAQAIAAEAQGA